MEFVTKTHHYLLQIHEELLMEFTRADFADSVAKIAAATNKHPYEVISTLSILLPIEQRGKFSEGVKAELVKIAVEFIKRQHDRPVRSMREMGKG